MRVLLTGASGFIGSSAARALLARGHDVTAMVRGTSDRRRLVALAPEAAVVEADLDAPAAVERAIAQAKPEFCVHLAWYAVPGKYLTAPENVSLLASSLRLVQNVVEAGCTRVLTAGTCFEYDTEQGWLREEGPLRPRWLYSASKRALGEMAAEVCRLAGASHAHLRFFYQYGPHESVGRLVPSLCRAFLADEDAPLTSGEQIRDFLHVEDVGRAVAHVVDAALDGPVNIGSGEPLAVRDLARTLARVADRESNLRIGALPQRPGDPPFVCADTRRLRGTGFRPKWTLEAGLADTLAYWKGLS